MIFTVFEMSNFVLTKQHLRFSALIGRKVRLKPIEYLSKFMMTLLQLTNHVGNGFDISRMEISALKTSLAMAKKFEDKELEALLEEDQNQTQEEFAESLGVTQ